MKPSAVILFVATCFVLAAPLCNARSAPATATIPALFLSDIHLDPYSDPAKVASLNSAPASEWPTILAASASPTQADDFAALRKACPARGIDTSDLLWRSSLAALHHDARHSDFVTISGDLLAHQFDCKYKTLLPAATHADYLSFTEKTIRYIITSLRDTLPGIPIYIAMGNNDSGCTDYALDPARDEFLGLVAKVVAEALPEPDRPAVLTDFAAGGYYNVPLAHVPHTRLIVLDDLYFSGNYVNCAGKPDPAPAQAQLDWLTTQLAEARAHRDHVWILSHIPPGVDLYSTARKLTNVCGGGQAKMYLGSEKLAEILAAHSGTITLALFGHTHSDEMRLITPPGHAAPGIGVPVKLTSSVTPVNGNRPTFTLATINPATATLTDFTVMMASNLTGDDTTWAPEYTYSSTYHQHAFNAAALSTLIAGFQADPAAAKPTSEAYLRDYFPGDVSSIIKFAWPQYACSMNHDSGAAFAACVCKNSAATK